MDYLVGKAIFFCLDHLENVINRWAWHYHILNPFHQTFVTGYENRPNGPCIYVCNHQVPNNLTCHQPCNTAQILVSAEHHRHFSDVRIEGEPRPRESPRIDTTAADKPKIEALLHTLLASSSCTSPSEPPSFPRLISRPRHRAPRFPIPLLASPPRSPPPASARRALPAALCPPSLPSFPRKRAAVTASAGTPNRPDPIRPEPARTNTARPGPAGRRTSSGCPRTPTSASPSSGGTCPSTTTSPSSAATSAAYNVIHYILSCR